MSPHFSVPISMSIKEFEEFQLVGTQLTGHVNTDFVRIVMIYIKKHSLEKTFAEEIRKISEQYKKDKTEGKIYK